MDDGNSPTLGPYEGVRSAFGKGTVNANEAGEGKTLGATLDQGIVIVEPGSRMSDDSSFDIPSWSSMAARFCFVRSKRKGAR